MATVIDAAGVIRANRVAAKAAQVSQRFLVETCLFFSENERQTFHFKLGRLQQAEQVQEWVVNLNRVTVNPLKQLNGGCPATGRQGGRAAHLCA